MVIQAQALVVIQAQALEERNPNRMNAPTASTEINVSSSAGLVALSDQLEAAVSDAYQAWHDFRFGVEPMAQTPDVAAPTDRIERVGTSIQTQIRCLRELANQIRERAS